jgi:8-oxo-dGTP pyrophosphatase MutT (NUDIX family)
VSRLDEIRRALAAHEPVVLSPEGARRAAVAMVLRDRPAGPDVLFIERARNEADPWSGHMAFPGGRVEPGDRDARRAAERETLEEVGVELGSAEVLGRLDDRQGNPITRPRLVISAWVYRVAEAGPLRPNHEVQEAFWFPLRDLLDPTRHVLHASALRAVEFPGILVGKPERHVVWGLTYSFLESFFLVVGRPLPDRWSAELRAYARGVAEAGAGAPRSKAGQRVTGSGG